jgi:predicted transcriptional regulator
MTDKHDELAAQIVVAYVAHNAVDPDGVAKLLREVRDVLAGDDSAVRGNGADDALAPPKVWRKPAVEPRQSVTANFIICLECEEKFATLKRHIRSTHGLTPEQYRDRHHLTPDYPMIAPAYAQRRKEISRANWSK